MSRRRKMVFRGGAAAAGVALLLTLAAVWSFAGPGPKAKDGEFTAVVLQRGAGVGRISDTLKDAGVISSAGLFNLAARLTGAASQLKAGEYDLLSDPVFTDWLDTFDLLKANSIDSATIASRFAAVSA